MSDDQFEMPVRPFFSCEETRFLVADGSQVISATAMQSLEPLLSLSVGPGNVFEQRPLRVTSHEGTDVVVECEGDEVVHLNFDDFTARKTTPEAEFYYKGDLDEGNDGLGFMRAR